MLLSALGTRDLVLFASFLDQAVNTGLAVGVQTGEDFRVVESVVANRASELLLDAFRRQLRHCDARSVCDTPTDTPTHISELRPLFCACA